MTALRAGDARVGCVLRLDAGVAVVMTDAGEVRAGLGGRLLGDVARDRRCAPQAGDWVRLCTWRDGRTTVEECLTTPPPAEATVLPFRRP